MLQNIYQRRKNFNESVDNLNINMELLSLPNQFKNTVITLYDTLWNKGLDQEIALKYVNNLL